MSSEYILYSFRRCPFAIRARWALLKNGIKVIIREVDLKEKPEELLKLSPKGTVPVLFISNSKILEESIDIIKWSILNSTIRSSEYNDLKINSEEAHKLIKVNDNEFKYHLDRFKYASRYRDIDASFHKNKALEIIRSLNEKIAKSVDKGFQGWLLEDSESIADLSLWPFIRQYLLADPTLFERDKDLDYIRNWLKYYISQKSFPKVMEKYKKWDKDDIPISFEQ